MTIFFYIFGAFDSFLFLIISTFVYSKEERKRKGGVEKKKKSGIFADSRPSLDTWLILPVVICLSQRLSHARVSISFYTVKLRMAH